MEHIFLREDEKLKRIETCDFFLDDSKDGQIKLCLQKISNPIIILFYYDSTSIDILSSFHRASRAENLQKDEDLDFMFGCINLNYERELYNVITRIDVGNPFKWLEMSRADELAMVAFYARKVPQFKYFGELTYQAVVSEFLNWKKDFQSLDYQKTIPDMMEEGLFLALRDTSRRDIENSRVSWRKGEIFKIRFLSDKVSMEKWRERREENRTRTIEYTFSKNPDNTDRNKGDKIDEEYVVDNFRRIEKSETAGERTLFLDTKFFETPEGQQIKVKFDNVNGN